MVHSLESFILHENTEPKTIETKLGPINKKFVAFITSPKM